MRSLKIGTLLLFLFWLGPLFGCTPSGSVTKIATPPNTKPAPDSGTGLFQDVAERAGVRFTHTTGSTGKFYFIENTPAGCAFFDYDNDGWLDILLVQSGSSDDPKSQIQNPKSDRPHCAL